MSVEFIALRAMKVQRLNPDGSNVVGRDGRPILRQVKPGEAVPEAVHWRNTPREVQAGRLGIKGIPMAGPALAETLLGQARQSPPPPPPRQAAPPSEGEAEEARRVRTKRAGKPVEAS